MGERNTSQAYFNHPESERKEGDEQRDRQSGGERERQTERGGGRERGPTERE